MLVSHVAATENGAPATRSGCSGTTITGGAVQCKPVAVTADHPTNTAVDFGFVRSGSLTGRAFVDVNGNGKVDQKQFRVVCATHSPVLIEDAQTYVINLDRHINRNVVTTDMGVEGASTLQ